MPSNKKRLYLALYPTGTNRTNPDSPQERRYHVAYLIAPKPPPPPQSHSAHAIPGTKYHVRNPPDNIWRYEEVPVANTFTAPNLLCRILIAKITDEQRLVAAFRSVPVVQGDPTWRCRTWVINALTAAAEDGKCLGRAELDWVRIEAVAREYVGGKIDGGRFAGAADMDAPRPCWDLLEGREVFA